MATIMTYGSYRLVPAPIINISKSFQRSGDGTKLGSVFRLSLNGTVTPIPTGDAGFVNVMTTQDHLRNAFTKDGCNFGISCDGVMVFSGNPRVGDINFSETGDNWTQRTAYTIDLEFDEEPEGAGEDGLAPPYIESAEEEWNLEPMDNQEHFSWELPTIGTDSNPFSFRLSHNVSAKGKRHYTVTRYQVTGNGGPVSPNGTYVDAGKYGGKHYYERQDGAFVIWWSGGASEWRISVAPNDVAAGRWRVAGAGNIESTYASITYTGNPVVTAVDTGCDSVERPAWQEAREYVVGRLGYEATQMSSSGVINLNIDNFVAYNHSRVQQYGELDGTFNATETWVVINPSGAGIPGSGHCLEDFIVNASQGLDNDISTISIEGSINGLSTIDYGTTTGDYSVTEDKYSAASGYWATVKSRLYYRAQLVHNDVITGKAITRSLNTSPTTISIGHSPSKGSINYSYEYNDRPSNCVPSALSEVISIVDNNPTDVFAQLTIMGRQLGPILQDINTITNPTRELSVEVVVPPATGCGVSLLTHTNPRNDVVTYILCPIEADLTGTYNQVFKTNDQETWNPKEGRYSRNVSYTYQDCSITGVTLLCP